ncbi:MAG: ribonucleotide reductase N-terminal alpha domain-containing protein, partial [Thermoplasmata archaeon]
MTDDALTENAKKILKERYLKRDKEGNIVESEDEMFKRVARAIAEINKEYDDDRSFGDEKDEFYEALTNLDFVPNSPTLMNAGLELGQLSACFVLSPLDDMDSIFQQVKNAAKIFQSGGGVGYSFSRLRPRGDTVKSTGGIASGPVSFMRVYDEMCNTIKQGGCLASDERVMTTNGYIPIREIHNGRPNSDAPSKALVKTREGFNQVIQTNDSGEMDVHTIKTEDGYNIRAVYEHPLLSVNNEGKLEFKRVDELTEGDIIVFDQSDKLVDKRQDLKEVDKKYHHNVQIADNLPYKVTDDLAIFLGLLWADGTFDSSNDRLVFSLAKDRSEKDWLVKTVSSWGLNVRVIDQKEKGKGDYWRVVIQSQHLMDWMRKNRLAKDITKIPEAIYRSPIAIPAFLGGFTADANIAKDANTVCYSTANKRTAENLQELLLLCGISSKIMRTESQDNRYSDKERFEVRVNPGRSAKLYEQKVPHFLNGKVGGAGGQRQNKVYFADKLVNSLLDENFIKNNKLPELPEDVDRKAMKELRRYERGERIPSRKRLVDVLERIGITDVPELSKNNLFQMITYNEEDSRAGVADIEVMHSSHNYIAGNAVV